MHDRAVTSPEAPLIAGQTVDGIAAVLEAMPAGALLLDREGTIVTANVAAVRLFGYPVAQLVGQTVELLVPAPLRNAHRHLRKGFAAAAGSRVMGGAREFPAAHADGTVFPAEIALSTLRMEDGVYVLAVISDVSERKAMRDALAASELRFRQVAESLPHIVWTCDASGSCDYMSPQWTQYTGVSAEDQRGFGWLERLHPEDRDGMRAAWHAASARGVEFKYEYRLRRHDGEHRWFETRAVPFVEDGAVVRWFGSNTDVHEARMTRQALAQERDRLAKIIATAPGAFCSFKLEPNGRATYPYASERIEEIFGLTAAQLAADASPALDRIDPQDVPRVRATIAESARTGEPWRCEYRVRHPQRGEIWIEGHSIPRNQPDGSVLWHGFLRDVTDRRRTEDALRSSDERFRQLAEAIREVFYLSDASNDAMLYVSPAYETIWGRSCSSLYESPDDWTDAIHPEDRAQVMQALRDKARAGTYDEEYRIVRPDGAIRWIRDVAFPVRDDAGNVIRVAGIADDITEHRKLEEQLRQSAKMESIGQLAGGVAHDFNNWLTVISGNGELLLGMLPDDPEACELVEEIRKASERAAALTRQLLAFSRQQVLEPRSLDLNVVVTETEKMLRRLLGEDVILTTTLHPELSRVRVDPGHIVQVLMNLAVNARDAMPRGGRLTIETRDVEFDAGSAKTRAGYAPGRYVLLALSDTGMGMDSTVLARVFEPFFTTKGVGEGTGLGLAVVHGIVEQSGGHIDVYSEPGIGTTFKVYLPAIDETVDRTETRPATSVNGTERILLVEDEDSVRRLAQRGLTRHGYEVHASGDPLDALALLDERVGGIDLLLTDVVMPNMDGRELAEVITRRYPHVKVLYTSGYTDDAVVRHGILHAEVAFLQKPYTPLALVRKVREVLDR